MDWSNLSTLLQSQLAQQLTLFVNKIESQDTELKQLRTRVQLLESQLQQQANNSSSTTSTINLQQQQQQAVTNQPHVNHPPTTTTTHAALAADPSFPPEVPSSLPDEDAHAVMMDETTDHMTTAAATSNNNKLANDHAQMEDDIRTHVPTANGSSRKRASSPTTNDSDEDQRPASKKPKNAATISNQPTTTAVAAPPGRTAPSSAAVSTVAHGLETQSIDPIHATPQATSMRKKTSATVGSSPSKLNLPAVSSSSSHQRPHQPSVKPIAKQSDQMDLNQDGAPAPSQQPPPAKPQTTAAPTTATSPVPERAITPQQAEQAPVEPSDDQLGFMFNEDEPQVEPSVQPVQQQHQPEQQEPLILSEMKDIDPVRSPKISVHPPPPPSPSPTKPSAFQLLTTSFPPAVVTAVAANPPHMELSPQIMFPSEPLVSAELRGAAEQFAAEGTALAARNDWKGSATKWNEAIRLLSEKSWQEVPINWLKQRSTVYAKLGDNREAHADAQRMMTHFPNHWAGYYVLSTLLGRDKNYSQALVEGKRAWAKVEKKKKTPAVGGSPQARAEKEADADRKKIIERIRQLELRLKVPPCELNEEEETVMPPEPDITHHLSPATAATTTLDSRSLLRTPQQQHQAKPPMDSVSPSSTRAPTAPSSPMPTATTNTATTATGATATNGNPHAPAARKTLDFHGAAAASSTPKPLPSGTILPLLTFGTYSMKGEKCLAPVTHALRCGYRRIDTGASYLNEEVISKALTTCGIPRSHIYLTSKIDVKEMRTEESVYACAINSLKKLDTKYLDCLLIHWPGRFLPKEPASPLHSQARIMAWKVLERLVGEGKCRSIGVSNYEVKHLKQLLSMPGLKIKPKVNQIELHPLLYQTQKPIIEYCQSVGIEIEAYMSLGGEKKVLLDMPLVAATAKACKRTVPEVLLQWSLQHGFIPLARSTNPSHIQSNMNVALKPFKLTTEQMCALDELEKTAGKKRFAWDPSYIV